MASRGAGVPHRIEHSHTASSTWVFVKLSDSDWVHFLPGPALVSAMHWSVLSWTILLRHWGQYDCIHPSMQNHPYNWIKHSWWYQKSYSLSSPSISSSSLFASSESKLKVWFSQSGSLHISVHFIPFDKHTHFGRTHFLAQLQASKSRTASGAGWPSIQCTTNWSTPSVFSICHPRPTGLGVSMFWSRQRLHMAAW